MIRRRLSVQLTLVMLLVALAPLAGAGYVTLHLLEQSIAEQVQASQEELARASSALVRDYLKDATTKLKSIAQMIRPGEDTQAQSRRLNTLQGGRARPGASCSDYCTSTGPSLSDGTGLAVYCSR